MRSVRSVWPVLVAVLFLASCSRSATTVQNAIPQAGAFAARGGAVAGTVTIPQLACAQGTPGKASSESPDLSFNDFGRRDFAPAQAALDAHAALAVSLARRTPDSVVSKYGQSGDLGVTIDSLTAPYVFVSGCALHSFANPGSFNVSSPSATKTNSLFAPTTRLPSQCYEIGTTYQTVGGKTVATLYVFDFCNTTGAHGGTVSKLNGQPVGSYYYFPNQQASYLWNRTFPDGVSRKAYSFTAFASGAKEYVAFDLTSGPALAPFPDNSGPIAEPTKLFPEANSGWSIFETHYYPGACPDVPSFASAALRYTSEYDGNSSIVTENYKTAIASGQTPSSTNGTQCITNDDTPSSWYYSLAGIGNASGTGWLTKTHLSANPPLSLDLASLVICNEVAPGGNAGCSTGTYQYTAGIDVANAVGPLVATSTTGITSVSTSGKTLLTVTANGAQTGTDSVTLTDQGTGQSVYLPVTVLAPGTDSGTNATYFSVTSNAQGGDEYAYNCVGDEVGVSLGQNTTLAPVTLKSADPTIATVAATTLDNFNWLVTLHKAGSTYLTATAAGYTEFVPMNAIIPPGGYAESCSLGG